MRRRRPVLAVVLPALLGGCAGMACTPATVLVARKEDRSQLRSEPRGLRTDEVGRLEEVRRRVIVSEYWVQDANGRWYRVSESAWRGRTGPAGRGLPLAPAPASWSTLHGLTANTQ